MATFLELCNDVAVESGTVAAGDDLRPITDVADVTGRLARCVVWTNKAWLHIQNARTDWKWMFDEFEDRTATGVDRYSPLEDFNLDRFGAWVIDQPVYVPFSLYDPAKGVADETELGRIEFTQWRSLFNRGAQVRARPTAYAIDRASKLCLGQIPDKSYVIRGEYRKSAQTLVANSDVPEMPSQFHSAIVWKAIELMAEFDEGIFQTASSKGKFVSAFRNIVNSQTGELT